MNSRERLRRILQSGALEGINLAPHTPIENTEALCQTGREFGKL